MVVDARRVMKELDLVRLDEPMLHAAADLDGTSLRALDAIHVAAAQSLQDDLATLITYDGRVAAAARGLGMPVADPA